MKTLLVTPLTFLAFSTLGYSQILTFSNIHPAPGFYIEEPIQIMPQDPQDTEFRCDVTNNTQDTLKIRVFRQYLVQVPGHENNICWGDGCWPHWIDSSTAAKTVTLAPGQLDTTFRGHVKPHELAGQTTMKYCFYDTVNPSDSICINVIYNYTPVGIKEESQSIITMGDPYPNPANQTVQVAFDIEGNSDGNTVEIFNAVGELIVSEELAYSQGIYTLDTSGFAVGIYHISMQSDGTSVSTKRFTITH